MTRCLIERTQNFYSQVRKKTPIVFGSALSALQNKNEELGKQSIVKLMDTVDSYIPTPERDTKSPFLLPIEKTVSVPGKLNYYFLEDLKLN